MEEIEQIKKEIEKLKTRNKKVEGDKAWETSFARKALIAVFTYMAIAIYLVVIKVDRPWLNAIVPAVGFTLSTLTMPYFKAVWIKHFWKR